RAGCFLPVSQSATLPDKLGSRHRAAIGLAESCDATVVIVSEERAEVSLVFGGSLEAAASPELLARRLIELGSGGATEVARGGPPSRRGRLRDLLALVVVLSLVVGAWWIVVGQPGTVVTRTV